MMLLVSKNTFLGNLVHTAVHFSSQLCLQLCEILSLLSVPWATVVAIAPLLLVQGGIHYVAILVASQNM
eukprot:6129992-Amphidinium_carterae.1